MAAPRSNVVWQQYDSTVRDVTQHATVPCPRLSTGEEDVSGEAGESDMDGQSESRHPAIGPEDWDGPSKFTSFLSLSLVVVVWLSGRYLTFLNQKAGFQSGSDFFE
jgi:hypothetical protein